MNYSNAEERERKIIRKKTTKLNKKLKYLQVVFLFELSIYFYTAH